MPKTQSRAGSHRPNSRKNGRWEPALHLCLLFLFATSCPGQTQDAQTKLDFKSKFLSAKRIVFLGDSNTDNGGFIHQIESAILSNQDSAPELINLGLPSETCSGLSEPAHPFPRPNLHERLGRALEKTEPDLVVACYGMNDGIYYPYSDERFAAFKEGINKLIAACDEKHIPLILLTPPPFDPLPKKKAGKLLGNDAKEYSWIRTYENYDSDVLKRYSVWLLELSNPNVEVIDVHSSMNQHVQQKRKQEPGFAFSKDGVHFNEAGHKVMAQSILNQLKFKFGLSKNKELLSLVKKRQEISHATWLEHVGHKRPGIKPGLPMDKAEIAIGEFSKKIAALLDK